MRTLYTILIAAAAIFVFVRLYLLKESDRTKHAWLDIVELIVWMSALCLLGLALAHLYEVM